jgi:hypothetical protein
MFINIKVGGQVGSIVVVKDPPSIVWNSAPVRSSVLMRASSHGPNPGCSAGTTRDCIYPTRPGGTFVPGSRAITDRYSSDSAKYGESFDVDRPDQVCVSMTQSTGACEVTQTAQGRLTAIERYPAPADGASDDH